MEVQIRSDGQLYPSRTAEKPLPPPKPPASKPKPPDPHPCTKPQEIPWEELLLIGVAFLVLQSKEFPDLPLLLALAYILFDRQFDLKKLFFLP